MSKKKIDKKISEEKRKRKESRLEKKRKIEEMKKLHGKIKKPKFLKVFYYEVHALNKSKKLAIEFFKVYAFTYLNGRLKVKNHIRNNMKELKIKDVYQITKSKLGDKIPIEISVSQNKFMKKEKIDFSRLQKLKHKKYGYIWITDPELMVSKDIIYENVLFYVPLDEERVEIKTFQFLPKYFELTLKQSNQVLRGTKQRRKSKFISIEEKLQLLRIYSERSIRIKLSSVEKKLDKLLGVASEEYRELVRSSSKEMVKEIMVYYKKTHLGTKLTLNQCITRIFRSNSEYHYEDLELACKILRKRGHKVPKASFLF